MPRASPHHPSRPVCLVLVHVNATSLFAVSPFSLYWSMHCLWCCENRNNTLAHYVQREATSTHIPHLYLSPPLPQPLFQTISGITMTRGYNQVSPVSRQERPSRSLVTPIQNRHHLSRVRAVHTPSGFRTGGGTGVALSTLVQRSNRAAHHYSWSTLRGAQLPRKRGVGRTYHHHHTSITTPTLI